MNKLGVVILLILAALIFIGARQNPEGYIVRDYDIDGVKYVDCIDGDEYYTRVRYDSLPEWIIENTNKMEEERHGN